MKKIDKKFTLFSKEFELRTFFSLENKGDLRRTSTYV